MIDDGINLPIYSSFLSFTPSVNLAGRVLLPGSAGVAVPYAGLTVYIDLNHNSVLDTPEPFVDLNYDGVYVVGDPFVDLNGNGVRDTYSEPYTVTNAQGQYYFYDVPPGIYTIGFDLPADRAGLRAVVAQHHPGHRDSDHRRGLHGDEFLSGDPGPCGCGLQPERQGRPGRTRFRPGVCRGHRRRRPKHHQSDRQRGLLLDHARRPWRSGPTSPSA